MRILLSHLILPALILLFALSVSSFSVYRSSHGHAMRRRSRLHSKRHLEMEVEQEPLEAPFTDEEEPIVREELSKHGVTRVIVDEEGSDGAIVEEGTEDRNEASIHSEKSEEMVTKNGFRQKLHHITGQKRKDGGSLPKEATVPQTTTSSEDDDETYRVTEPSSTVVLSSTILKSLIGKDNPMAMPMTTEGKRNTKRKLEDPLKVYGFPKELLPIVPGGGSRFEDVEREKLEKKKMSQTKGNDEDSVENGSSHEAEGLYSSASLSSFSLVFYCLVTFLHLDRIFL